MPFGAFSIFDNLASQNVGRRGKLTKIWASRVSMFNVYRVSSTVEYSMSFWGHSVHFRKQIEKGQNLGFKVIILVWYLLAVKCSRSLWGHLKDFWFSTLCLSKRAKWTKIWASQRNYLVLTRYFDHHVFKVIRCISDCRRKRLVTGKTEWQRKLGDIVTHTWCTFDL